MAERIVAHLSDALVDLGHQVTLFSSADAQTRAELVPMRDQAFRLDPSPLKSDCAVHLTMLHEMRRRARARAGFGRPGPVSSSGNGGIPRVRLVSGVEVPTR
ncbi:hypothetical protein [Inquilinus limosus]|uniref:Uncharacterized protein n=1 Tax=Inquilinus limosus MP06 TaxID=1398085 RepID=A0A0A0DCQ5_9PROT|nr:hypothetical protein P409_01780 [Inquilinus limosus MP06]